MDHFYEDICGFSQNDLFALYKKMVEKFPSGSHFVEVGTFLGKSASFMAVEIINSGKRIKFDCVDHWLGSPEHKDNDEINIDDLYEDFIKNIEPVKGVINPMKMSSITASKLYKPNSLDFIFSMNRNTAIAEAKNPIMMAESMKHAVLAGRKAFRAERMKKRKFGSPSSPQENLI